MPHKAATYSCICAEFFPFYFAFVSRIYAPQGYSRIVGCVSSSCASNSFAYWSSPPTIVTSTHIYAILQAASLLVSYSRLRDGLLFSRVLRVFRSLLSWTTSLHLSYFLRPLLLSTLSPQDPSWLSRPFFTYITGNPHHRTTELSSAYSDWNRFLPVCVLRQSNAGSAFCSRQGRPAPELRRGGIFEQDQLRIFLSTYFWVIGVSNLSMRPSLHDSKYSYWRASDILRTSKRKIRIFIACIEPTYVSGPFSKSSFDLG